MLLSGPAGGLAGAQYVGGLAGRHRLLSFDMGGTSTDVALLDSGHRDALPGSDLPLTTEGRIGPYPVGVPMVDMHTIGAGGGSIARVDAGGLLQVGPESAGADPGPACYGRNGQHVTVTDANLILGRLRSDAFLGGHMTLDEAAARTAMQPLAEALNLSLEQTAQGIIDVANEHMARALRMMSVQRGIDAAQLTLTCFGGAGGLHVCALADAMEMQQALVPAHAGVLSALGMLAAPPARYLSHTWQQALDETMDEKFLEDVKTVFAALAQRGRDALTEEGAEAHNINVKPSVDLRYRGQSFVINLPIELPIDGTIDHIKRALRHAETKFHGRHTELYGHDLKQVVELVTLRVKIHGPAKTFALHTTPKIGEEKSAAPRVSLSGIDSPVPVYVRDQLHTEIVGPALITETVSTTFLAPGWSCTPDASGCLLLARI
jgi:N-methylhydantoinase A